MKKLKLISFPICPYVQRSLIVLNEKGIDYDLEYIDLLNKPEWFLKLSPTGKVPVLVVDGDTVLFESAVICEYLNEVTPGSLHSEDPLVKAQHRSWIEFSSGILSHIAGFFIAEDQKAFQGKMDEIKGSLQRLEGMLQEQEGPYFAGEEFQVIDAVYGPLFRYFDVFDTVKDFGFFEGLPKTQKWRKAILERESVKNAVSKDYAEQLIQFYVKEGRYLNQFFKKAA